MCTTDPFTDFVAHHLYAKCKRMKGYDGNYHMHCSAKFERHHIALIELNVL